MSFKMATDDSMWHALGGRRNTRHRDEMMKMVTTMMPNMLKVLVRLLQPPLDDCPPNAGNGRDNSTGTRAESSKRVAVHVHNHTTVYDKPTCGTITTRSWAAAPCTTFLPRFFSSTHAHARAHQPSRSTKHRNMAPRLQSSNLSARESLNETPPRTHGVMLSECTYDAKQR